MKYDFACVGFAKCATTTLYAILAQHPDIVLPCHKESPFFREDSWYERGIEWYEKRYFGRCLKECNDKVVGMVDPCATWFEDRIMKRLGSDIKFIYLLRNPVNASFSLYKHRMRWGENGTKIEENLWRRGCFDEFVAGVIDHPDKYPRHSRSVLYTYRYGNYLSRVLKFVPRSNIYLLTFEELVNFPEREIKKLFNFIGVREDVELKYTLKKNVGEDRVPRSELWIYIYKILFNVWYNYYVSYIPYLGNKVEQHIDSVVYEKINIFCTKKDFSVTMSETTRNRLREYYRKDIARLDEIFGTDFVQLWTL